MAEFLSATLSCGDAHDDSIKLNIPQLESDPLPMLGKKSCNAHHADNMVLSRYA